MVRYKKYLLAAFGAALINGQAWGATGIQVGSSGKTYASSVLHCAVHPANGMSPVVQAGLYDPKRAASAAVSLNGTAVATVTFFNPEANVWLVNGLNRIAVSLGKRSTDLYTFDATASEENICLPDTTRNFVIGDLEYAASNSLWATTYATVSPGCAKNPATGGAQPFITVFDSSSMVFDVSANNVPIAQLGGALTETRVFLVPGWNVITAANVGFPILDYYVREGGDGTCTLR